MIIRATFNDNDFTSLLNNYFELFMFKNYKQYISSISDAKKYVEESIKAEDALKYMIYSYSKDLINNKDEADKQLNLFINIVQKSISYYINGLVDKDTYKYLIEHLDISVSNTITSKDENGEVVYCFIPQGVILVC